MASRKTDRLMQLARMIIAKEEELAALRTEFARLADGPVQLRLADGPVQLQLPIDEAVTDEAQGGSTALPVDSAALLERINAVARHRSPLRPPVRAKLSPPTLPTLADRALKLMKEQAHGFTAADLATTLGAPIDTTRTLLSKLHARGLIRRGGRGEYFSLGAARAAGED